MVFLKNLRIVLVLVIVMYSYTQAQKVINTEILKAETQWDEWDVPHISAENEPALYFGFGRTQMKLHANSILKMYGESRAKASEYWGEGDRERDLLLRKLNIPNRAKTWYVAQTPEMQKNIQAFVNGMNTYCEENPNEIDENLKVVLPITAIDPFAYLQVAYHLNVGAFALQSQMAQWKNAGSNAWAIGPSKSQSGNTMLLIQPHPPWMDYYKFLEVHLKCKEFNAYGIALIGSPMIAMGFNENLGWGMTFNQADAFDLFELQKKNGGYIVDDSLYSFKERTEIFSFLESGKLRIDSIVCKESIHGFIIEENDKTALAMRLSGLDKPEMMTQFIKMASAKNRKEFETALSMLQMPLQNIIYADRNGEIMYVYNGIIPKRHIDRFDYWQQILPGEDSRNIASEYFEYKDLPKFYNPPSGFIANSNNPPWTSTFPPVLFAEDYPAYTAPQFMDFRSQRSAKMLLENDKISFEELSIYQSSTKSELAERCLEELVDFAQKAEDNLLSEAAGVLKMWDKQMTPASKGAVLFTNWFFSSRKNMFKNPWNPKDPLNTPNTLTSYAKQNLKSVVRKVKEKYGQLDVTWGDIYRIQLAGQDVASSIGINELGAFQAGFYRSDQQGKYKLLGGTAYSMIIEFGVKVKAKAILPYGNSSQKPSDKQIHLFSRGKLRDIYFYKSDISKNVSKIAK